MAGREMNLNEFAAARRLSILADLQAGRNPEGTFSEERLREARAKGKPPQMGTTRFEPDAVHFEFIYPDPQGSPIILTVTVKPLERIVFMPVPPWVVESIWQGEIAGSAHFESDAQRLLEEFRADLSPERNPSLFAGRDPVGRDG